MSRSIFTGRSILILIIVFLISVAAAQAQTTVFTYQGRFTDSTLPQPTNGTYEMQFTLFDTSIVGTGTQAAPTQNVGHVSVAGGIFTTQLDYGSTIFRGTDLFIEIAVRPLGSSAAFTVLSPRQAITAVPVAIRSRNANAADLAANADALGGFPASDYVQTVDPRLTDARNPVAGNNSYIQNQTAISQAANFNVLGNGIVVGNFGVGGTITGNGANITGLNAGNITAGTLPIARGGTGIIASGASGNFLRSNGTVWASSPFLATDIPTGSGSYIQNATLQQATSNFNVSGNGTAGGTISGNIVNSTTNFRIGGSTVFSTPNGTSVVIGQFANHSLLGSTSTFVGFKAGLGATSFSQANTFIGSEAGEGNTSGGNNSFVGKDAGLFNTSGSFNAFFGSGAGVSNKTASDNSFFGYQAGASNSTGTRNSLFGSGAGQSGTTASDNSFFGYLAGSSNTAGNNAFFGSSAGVDNVGGSDNTFVGTKAGFVNTSGANNTFIGSGAGDANVSGTNNTFVGYQSGSAGGENTTVGASAGADGNNNTNIGYNAFAIGNDNTVIGHMAKVIGPNTVSHSTAIGADAVADTSNTVVIGASFDNVEVPGNLRVSGDVNAEDFNGVGVNAGSITATGQLKTVLMAGGSTQVCRNNQNILSTCSSSLRYKTNIGEYSGGLDYLKRLHPITFDWKDGGMHDVGFGAEDVEKIDPILVIYNGSGQVEGVKYDRISVVLVNSVKEQQTQITLQAEQIKQQTAQIEALTQIVCSINPAAKICIK